MKVNGEIITIMEPVNGQQILELQDQQNLQMEQELNG